MHAHTHVHAVFPPLDATAFILFRWQAGGDVYWRAAFIRTIIST